MLHTDLKHRIAEVLEESRKESQKNPAFTPSIRNRTHPSITKRYLYERDDKKLEQYLTDAKKLLGKYQASASSI